MSKALVIRLVTPSGRSRIELGANATLEELQAEIAKKTSVEPSAQSLALDDKGQQAIRGAGNTPLANLGITNGAQVYLKNQDASIAAQVLTKVPVPVEPEKPIPKAGQPAPAAGGSSSSSGAAASSSVAKPSANSSSSSGPDGKKVEPKFETFDSFLRNRRYDVSALPGSQKFVSGTVKQGGMIKIPPSVSIKQQPYRHVDNLSFMNATEMTNFVNYWTSECLTTATQRCGWMYGYYREDNKNYDEGCVAVLEGIYEPPQEMVYVGDVGSPMPKDDPFRATVDKVAEALGLERIGWIFTALGMDDQDIRLSPTEVVKIARLQNDNSTDIHFTKYRLSKFVSCVVRPETNGEGGIQPKVEPFMVSDQCCAMVRDDIIDEDPGRSGNSVVIRQAQKNELIPSFLVESKPTPQIETDFFVVRLNDTAPKKLVSIFCHNEFPTENRAGPYAKTAKSLSKYFKSIDKKEPSWKQYADFHLILHLAQLIDVDTAMIIANSVRDRVEIPDGVRMIVDSLAG